MERCFLPARQDAVSRTLQGQKYPELLTTVMRNKFLRFCIAAVVLIILGGLLYAGYNKYINEPRRPVPLVYSENTMLLELWNNYKANNIEPGTNRTLDKQQNNITTSEGQSYTMLRAVWVDDQDTFDKSWKWTKDNLQRDDKLMSWKFGVLPDGKYGIQDTVGGKNTATDGDSDIALALLMAYTRWNESKYLADAQPIIDNIWQKEVVFINNKPVLVSNDIERNNPDKVIVNPSYFSPYAYKVFADADPTHNWKSLADNSYDILKAVSSDKLDRSSSGGLPPDWVTMDRKTGSISASDNGSLTTDYSYDALRTPWRMALDYSWFKDERAKEVLNKYSLLNDEWNKNKKIYAKYSHDGKANADYESIAAYGGGLGYFKVIKPDTAKDIYKNKLQILYDPNGQRWKNEPGYYDDNWAWFGMALMEDALPNLTETKQN